MFDLTNQRAETADPGFRPKSGRRAKLYTAGTLVFVLSAFGGGWFAASSFQSPAQRAAAAKAPPASAVTAEVGTGALEQTISINAIVSRQTQQQVTVTGAASPAVVTKQTLASGAAIAAGKVALEVNGRPVFAMPGKFPFYRDLHPGDTGPDVAQLQQGLRAGGYSVPSDGKFGKSTDAATHALYKAAGYTVSTSITSGSATSGSARGIQDTAGPQSTANSSGTNSAGTNSGGAATDATTLTIPLAEVLMFASLPAYIVSAPAIGTLLDAKSTISIEAGIEVANATVAASVAVSLRTGMTATLTGPDGTTIPVTVGTVGPPAAATVNPGSADGASPATSGTSTTGGGVTSDATTGGAPVSDAGGDVAVVLVAGSVTLPESWLRATALAIITVSVAAKDSLLVPTIAVVTGGKGQAHVLKRLPDGSFRTIAVDEVGQMAGRSAVTVKDPKDLAAGDTVKVG